MSTPNKQSLTANCNHQGTQRSLHSASFRHPQPDSVVHIKTREHIDPTGTVTASISVRACVYALYVLWRNVWQQNFCVAGEVKEHMLLSRSPQAYVHVHTHYRTQVHISRFMSSGMIPRLVVTDVSGHLSASIFRTLYSYKKSAPIHQSILVQHRRRLQSSPLLPKKLSLKQDHEGIEGE